VSALPKTISSQLSAAQLVITNTLGNQAISYRLAARGYDASTMAEGQRLCDAAKAAVDAQAAAAGAQRLATEQARAAERKARESYAGLVQTVRAVFSRNAPERTALEVTRATPYSSAAFIAAATTLFNNALSIQPIAAVLARYGYDAGALRSERDCVMAFQQALQAQAQAKGAAKQATRVQTEALAALHRWMAQYVKIARVALRNEPALLKALGITPQISRPTVQRSLAQEAHTQTA
jgi:hypothetical protein